MSGGRWPLAREILRIVQRDVARDMSDLAEMTGAPMAEVRRACWALVNAKRLAFCAGYFAEPAPARRATERAA